MNKQILSACVVPIFLLFSASMALGAWHESPCTHICGSPSCVVAAIEGYEASIGAGCANHDGGYGTPSQGTGCTMMDAFGAKKESRATLECGAAGCSIGGTIKCSSLTGFKVANIGMDCPTHNGFYPEATIHPNGDGAGGAYAVCNYDDGYSKVATCDSSGVVHIQELIPAEVPTVNGIEQ